MRSALWLLALFGMAVAVALFAGNNQGTVTLYWPPYRIDLSLNLVLLLLVAAFLFLHTALRALAALFDLPRQALRWRTQQKERAMHAAVLDAYSNLIAGRFIRGRKSAESALQIEASLAEAGHPPANHSQFRALAHLLAAECAQALQDRAGREQHLQQALEQAGGRDMHETREGALMRGARWALDDRDADAAIQTLQGLSQGAARRTIALRLRLKAARLAGRTAEALDTARLLAKHRAFSPTAARSILRGLALDLLNAAYDPAQLQRTWNGLDAGERALPDVAIHAANRLVLLGGDAALARDWLLPVWEEQSSLDDALKVKLVAAIEDGLQNLDGTWLARIEAAQKAEPRDATLQYLAGMACMRRELWGKAQQLLSQAVAGLEDATLRRKAWNALAELAEGRDDARSAAQAWKRAASS